MRVLEHITPILVATAGCRAFRPDVSTTFFSVSPPANGILIAPRTLRQTRPLRLVWSTSMSLDAESVTEAIRQATHVLADSSRGGAVVDQIPYVPAESVDNFDKIVIGSAACVLAYAWAAYEFGKRIVTQRACEVCEGSGLVTTSRTGKKLKQPKKCYSCGGFLPWENWGRFWQTNMDVGNGGVLQRPASDYEELNAAARAAKEAQKGDREI